MIILQRGDIVHLMIPAPSVPWGEQATELAKVAQEMRDWYASYGIMVNLTSTVSNATEIKVVSVIRNVTPS